MMTIKYTFGTIENEFEDRVNAAVVKNGKLYVVSIISMHSFEKTENGYRNVICQHNNSHITYISKVARKSQLLDNEIRRCLEGQPYKHNEITEF